MRWKWEYEDREVGEDKDVEEGKGGSRMGMRGKREKVRGVEGEGG